MTAPYSILLFGSHPDEENDDCFTGVDFDTREEAEKVFHAKNPIAELAALCENPSRFASYYHDTPFIMLDGPPGAPGEPPVRKLREPKRRRENDDGWRREHAMQQGMAFGCDGYNEAMGWD